MRRLRCFGEVRFGPAGFENGAPEYAVLAGDRATEAALTPYARPPKAMHQLTLRKLTSSRSFIDKIPEWLQPETLAELKLTTLQEAVSAISPPPNVDVATLESGQHPAVTACVRGAAGISLVSSWRAQMQVGR